MAEVENEEANAGAGRASLKLGLGRIAKEEGCALRAKALAANLRTGALLKAEDASIVNGSVCVTVLWCDDSRDCGGGIEKNWRAVFGAH